MKRKSKKKDAVSEVTVDWPHRYVVKKIDYARPSATTTPGAYQTHSTEDFEACLKEACASLSKLDVSVEQKGILETLIDLHGVQKAVELAETRIMHQRECIGMRTDVEADYDRSCARIRLMEERLAELEAEIRALEQQDGKK